MEFPEGGYLQALVPIYGTKDAGRGLWRRVYRVCVGAGLQENFALPALYHHAADGRTRVMLATHVDDVIWACAPGYEHIVEAITKELLLGKQSKGTFRFCGREFAQDPTSFDKPRKPVKQLPRSSISSV